MPQIKYKKANSDGHKGNSRRNNGYLDEEAITAANLNDLDSYF